MADYAPIMPIPLDMMNTDVTAYDTSFEYVTMKTFK